MTLPFRQVHLDCHTPELPYDFAYRFDKKAFQDLLIQSHINSITLTARCHHGHIYYETSLAAKHPNLVNDFLMEMVDACHEINVRCPLYLTVGWDAFMAKRHPEWLEIQQDGKYYGFENYGQLEPGWKTLCFNSEYVDYLKETIKDVMQHFAGKLDGLFFDILWQDSCYCNHCLEKMVKQGYDPHNPKDVKKFADETEVKTKKEIASYVRSIDPHCPIFFNEGNITPRVRPNLDDYSHIEIESLPSAAWGYQHFPTTVRYAKNLGKDYVGMTARFHRGWADFGSYKNLPALKYECLLSLAHGGQCSIGDQIYGDGSFNQTAYKLIEQVYADVERKEEFCKEVSAVSQIAIMHTGIIDEGEEKVDASLGGAVNLLNELHYQFDIIDDQMDFDHYQLIIFPDKITFNDTLNQKVQNYCQNGGKILLTYHSGLQKDNTYPSWMKLNYLGESPYQPIYIRNEKLLKDELVYHGQTVYVESEGALSYLEEPLYQRTYEHYYGHYHAPVDKSLPYASSSIHDSIGYIAHNIFEQYRHEEVYYLKQYVHQIIKELIGEDALQLKNFPNYGDVIFNHQENKHRYILHLLYYIPARRGLDMDTIEDEIMLSQIEIKISKDMIKNHYIQSIKALTLNQSIKYQEDDQYIYFNLPQMKGHEMIILEY